MQLVTSIPAWKQVRLGLGGAVGLVPTMGALHAGHVALVRRCRAENDVTVVWIFVNPKQFGPSEDFARYPRDLARDMRLLETEGVDYILSPTVEEVYPEAFQTTVNVEGLTRPLEGAVRPGHFQGVTTIVAKMFCLTQPRRAYFGQKDAQQSLVVQRLVFDLGMLTEVVVCPTVREADGLAMSSRNVYLDAEERAFAPTLYRALQAAERAIAAGERDADALRERMRREFSGRPGVSVDYVSIADVQTLQELATVDRPALLSLAVRVGRTRLIDNIPMTPPGAGR
ncbi:MAG: pantoate--beta-alanine ligase [Candidatus Lambdaproteobacteria bacterium]|nr:pantoate--beta-alanine ligase [Candidatus Lambdaproteobacteria bacterium]